MVNREKDFQKIKELISAFPITALLGARQIGKTTLARQFGADYYFDLENPRDLARLDQPQLTLENLTGMIVIDEIQRIPELFPLLRFLVDTNKQQKYLILGSASKDLIRQSSESLAGRIAFYYLSGFQLHDIGNENLSNLWLRGGFPLSYLAASIEQSNLWREQYITTLLERDFIQLGINIPSNTLRRFWTMMSHYHGQILNYSELARSFGISDMTVRKYIEIFEGTFMVRILQPWYQNIKKRLVKRPKIYIRDSGIFHTLMTINAENQLHSNPKLGASWEGFALECIIEILSKQVSELYFWATHAGGELDLFWQNKGKNWGIDFKFMDAPKKTKSFNIAIDNLNLEHLWVVYPGKDNYKLANNITVFPLNSIGNQWIYP